MGKVFSAEEIMLRQLPEPGAHEEAAKYVVSQLFFPTRGTFSDPSAWLASGIQSGLVHGSATHGTANIRSDLDLLAIYYGQMSAEEEGALEVIRKVNAKVRDDLHVDVETNALTIDNVIGRNHRIDPIFLRYLLQAEANPDFSWNFPAEFIATYFGPKDFTHIAFVDCLQKFIGVKSAKFDKALALPEKPDLRVIQRALELPKNVGRKVLSVFIDGFEAGPASTKDIMRGVEEVMLGNEAIASRNAKNGLGALFDIRELDAEYDSILADAASGALSPIEYEEWLERNEREILLLASFACQEIQAAFVKYRRALDREHGSRGLQSERLFDPFEVETFHVGPEKEEWY